MKKTISWLASGVCTLMLTIGISVMFAPTPAYAAPTPNPSNPTPSVNICGQNSPKCDNFVDKYINPIVLLLSVLAGVLAVISIIIAGIQYSASADDPAMVAKAKKRIFNTVLGLIAYIFLFAFLNYLIPGGIL